MPLCYDGGVACARWEAISEYTLRMCVCNYGARSAFVGDRVTHEFHTVYRYLYTRTVCRHELTWKNFRVTFY